MALPNRQAASVELVGIALSHTVSPLRMILLLTLAAGYAIGWFSRRRD